eukprot:355051-Chlamydomonas_euryale.AAC.2
MLTSWRCEGGAEEAAGHSASLALETCQRIAGNDGDRLKSCPQWLQYFHNGPRGSVNANGNWRPRNCVDLRGPLGIGPMESAPKGEHEVWKYEDRTCGDVGSLCMQDQPGSAYCCAPRTHSLLLPTMHTQLIAAHLAHANDCCPPCTHQLLLCTPPCASHHAHHNVCTRYKAKGHVAKAHACGITPNTRACMGPLEHTCKHAATCKHPYGHVQT